MDIKDHWFVLLNQTLYMHALSWYYFGISDFSCKYLIHWSFLKVDMQISCSCFLWIPPAPGSLIIHEIELSSYPVFFVLLCLLLCLFVYLFIYLFFEWWDDIINGQVVRAVWRSEVMGRNELNGVFMWLNLCSSRLVQKCWPLERQGKQDMSGFRFSTHPVNKLQIYVVMEQVTTEGKMGLIPNLVKSPSLPRFHMHEKSTCMPTFLYAK